MDNFHRIIKVNRLLYRHIWGRVILSKIIWRIIRLYYSCDIPPSVECDGVYFAHSGFGCLFNGRSKIGKGTTIQHSVTIGEVRGKVPVIGENCYIGARAIIIGNVIIGNNVTVGAGTVVTKSISDNSTVVGNPMKIIKNGSSAL